MQDIDLSLLYEDSFVEFKVVDSKLDMKHKVFVMTTKGAWLDQDENSVLKAAKINMTNWISIKVRLFHEDTKLFSDVEPQTNILSDIIKFYWTNESVLMQGFGVNGGWVEWEFVNPTIKVTGEVDNG